MYWTKALAVVSGSALLLAIATPQALSIPIAYRAPLLNELGVSDEISPSSGSASAVGGYFSNYIGVDDLNAVLSNSTRSVSLGGMSDPTLDGLVGVDDLNFVLANFTQPTPRANFYLVEAEAGEQVTVDLDLIDTGFDPTVWIFQGQHGDTDVLTDVVGTSFDLGSSYYVASDRTTGDGYDHVFTAPTSDFYTVAVVATAFSNPVADGMFDYTLAASASAQNSGTPTPEPNSVILGLLGLGSLGAMIRRRRA